MINVYMINVQVRRMNPVCLLLCVFLLSTVASDTHVWPDVSQKCEQIFVHLSPSADVYNSAHATDPLRKHWENTEHISLQECHEQPTTAGVEGHILKAGI